MMIDNGLEEQATREVTPTKNTRGISGIQQWGVWAIAAALAVWMIIAWGHLAGTVIRYYSPLPYWDYWETVPRYQLIADGHWLSGLWPQHNEHRIVFPALVFAADYRFFAGREVLPVFLNVVFYLTTWAVISAVLIRSDLPRFAAVWASLIAGIVMAWEGAALEIATAFQVQWSLLLVGAALALLFLARVPRSPRPRQTLGVAVFLAFVVNYSAANGLAFWVILLGAAWLLGLSLKQIAVLGIAGAVSCCLYFVGYHISHETDLQALVRHPLYAAEFVGAYLGSPFTVAKHRLGIAVGWAGLAAFLVGAVTAARRRVLGSSTGVVLAGMYCVCFLTAAITAVGRMNPNDPGFGAATAQRYVIVPLVADACGLAMLAWIVAARAVYCVVSLLFVITLWLTSSSFVVRSWCEFMKGLLRNTQVVALAVESGVDDARVLVTAYPDITL
jgi:hypothetical protein